MRFAVALTLAAVAAAPATACPQGASCIRGVIVRAVAPEAPAPARATATPRTLRLTLTDRRPTTTPLVTSLATYSPEPHDDLEVPWIWQVLAAEVYDRLPRYDQREQKFSMVLSPVVVSSPSDSVPGVGLAGDF